MGWTTITNPFDADQTAQYWDAIQECRVILGAASPFPQCHEWETFNCESIVDNGDGTFTVTDSTKDWTFLISGVPHKRWTEATPGSNGIPQYAPHFYDVVIDCPRSAQPGLSQPDWKQVVHGAITDQPSATSIKVGKNLARVVSEGAVPSVAAMVGRTGWVMRNGGDDWTRGPIRWPNARVYCSGDIATVPGVASLTSAQGLTQLGSLIGKQIIYEPVPPGGPLQRGIITAADPATRALSFSGTTVAATPGRKFYVIPVGGYFQFGRVPGPVLAAHAGPTAAYATHTRMPSDGVGGVGIPVATVDIEYGEVIGACTGIASPVTIRGDADGLDVDEYVGFANVCAAGDYFVSPNWWQCWRAVQMASYRLAVNFMNPDPTHWYGAAAVFQWTYATWLYDNAINGHSATAGTHSGTTLPCALGVGAAGDEVNIWWTIIDTDGSPMLSGYHQAYDGAQISHASISAAHDGKTVRASTGYDRICERVFDLFYAVTVFQPDLNAGVPVVPPTDAFPGTFVRYDPPDHYVISNHDGSAGRSTLLRHRINNGERARYVGHRAADPGFPVAIGYDALSPDPMLPYYNNAYVGNRADGRQAALEASRRGTAQGGSAVRVVDTARDWDAIDFPPATNGKTHAFTPVTGSTTGCTVPGANPAGLWKAARFPGGNPFVDFCIEVEITGVGFGVAGAVVEKRIIATGTTGGVITWGEPLSVSAVGLPCRIVEPMVLNPYKGRPVVLTTPGAAAVTATIAGSHGDTLFIVDPGGGYVTAAGTTYDIQEPRIGDVFKRVAGAWVSTASEAGAADTGRFGTGVSAVFLKDASANRPDWYVEKGFVLPGDITFGTNVGTDQLKATIRVLKAFLGGGAWDNPAANNRDASWHNEITNYGDWSNHVINGDGGTNPAYYLHGSPNTVSGAPFAHWLATGTFSPWDGSVWQTGPGWSGRVDRQFNVYRTTPPQTPFPKTVYFFNRAEKFGTTSSTPSPSPTVQTGTFDANGDPVAENVYTFWSQKSVTTGDAVSDPLGSLAVPDDAGAPAKSELPAGGFVGDIGTVSHRKGYLVNDVKTIIVADKVFA